MRLAVFIIGTAFAATFVGTVSAETLEEEDLRCNNTCRPLLKGVTPLKEAKRVVHNCLTGCKTQAQTEDSFMICPDGIGYRLRQPESDCSTKWKALTNN